MPEPIQIIVPKDYQPRPLKSVMEPLSAYFEAENAKLSAVIHEMVAAMMVGFGEAITSSLEAAGPRGRARMLGMYIRELER